MHASATGASSRQSRLSCAAENTNAADMASTNSTASVMDMRPAGSSRFAVRGFDASNRASTSLLNPIAAERAVTMHATIQPACDMVTGCALDASSAPVSANGSANTEWLKRTNDKYTRMRSIMALACRTRAGPRHVARRTSHVALLYPPDLIRLNPRHEIFFHIDHLGRNLD